MAVCALLSSLGLRGWLEVWRRGWGRLAFGRRRWILAQLAQLAHGVIDPLSFTFSFASQAIIILEPVRVPYLHQVFVRLRDFIPGRLRRETQGL